MRPGLIEKEAQALAPGDVLFPTDKVIVAVQFGLRTPAGKVEVTYRTKRGDLRSDLWGCYTKIAVIDPNA